MRTAGQLAAALSESIGAGHEPLSFVHMLESAMAPEVVFTHTPGGENDGPRSSAEWAARESAFFTTIKELVPDFGYASSEVSVESDVAVSLINVVSGTLPNGTVHSFPMQLHLTLEDGMITAMESAYDAEATRPLAQLIPSANTSS